MNGYVSILDNVVLSTVLEMPGCVFETDEITKHVIENFKNTGMNVKITNKKVGQAMSRLGAVPCRTARRKMWITKPIIERAANNPNEKGHE